MANVISEFLEYTGIKKINYDKVAVMDKYIKYRVYVLVERKADEIREFLIRNNIKAYVSTSISDIENKVIVENNPCLLVIAESGFGEFTGTVNRKTMADLIGVGDTEYGKYTAVLYSDDTLRSECSNFTKSRADIGWRKYNGTVTICEYIKDCGIIIDSIGIETGSKKIIGDIRVNPEVSDEEYEMQSKIRQITYKEKTEAVEEMRQIMKNVVEQKKKHDRTRNKIQYVSSKDIANKIKRKKGRRGNKAGGDSGSSTGFIKGFDVE